VPNGSKKAAKDIMEYLRTDVRETENGYQMRIAPKEESRHHFEAITRLMREVPESGWKTEEIEAGLYYVAISCCAPESAVKEAFEAITDFASRSWCIISVNELKEVVRGYYPFPLAIRDAECLYRFYNGEFVVNVMVDMGYVNRSIADGGIRVEFADDGWKIEPLLRDDLWGERYVSQRAVGQIAGEFLSLRWFIDNMLLGEMLNATNRMIESQTDTAVVTE
jgi:hypothetical protein